jgi:nucleotide-binding universal stress UspA family protein
LPLFKHILLATDFSEASQNALTLAVDMAHTLGCDLTVVHACEIPVYAYSELSMAPVDLLSPVVELAGEKLADLMTSLARRPPRAKSVLKVGVPWEEILAVAAETAADLIVMGTHGRRGVAHALLGSVAEKVVRMSPVPVMTVRAPSR